MSAHPPSPLPSDRRNHLECVVKVFLSLYPDWEDGRVDCSHEEAILTLTAPYSRLQVHIPTQRQEEAHRFIASNCDGMRISDCQTLHDARTMRFTLVME